MQSPTFNRRMQTSWFRSASLNLSSTAWACIGRKVQQEEECLHQNRAYAETKLVLIGPNSGATVALQGLLQAPQCNDPDFRPMPTAPRQSGRQQIPPKAKRSAHTNAPSPPPFLAAYKPKA